MRVAIIGCGLIGQKRAHAVSVCNADVRLVACVDRERDRAQRLAAQYTDCIAYEDEINMLEKAQPDAVIIATTHDSLALLGQRMIHAGKHVFLEKPAGRNSVEIESLLSLAENKKICIRVGFNHRYHRAFQQAKKIIEQNELGELMFIRARYGHGGRLGYENEWRANPAISGGGELIDQGVHLIDLSRWILGEFTEVNGFAHTYFWNMPVEDNGFLLLKTKKNQVAFLHASCTEWKNLFSFEIYGKTGKLHINGLGGSYGTESLAHYKMTPKMGPPDTVIYEYPMIDQSWELEIQEFIQDIRLCRNPSSNLHDALSAIRIVERVYQGAWNDCYA